MSWNSRRNSKFTNIILVIICIALIVVLGGLLLTNRKEMKQESERLQKLSEKQETGIDNYETVKEHASRLTTKQVPPRTRKKQVKKTAQELLILPNRSRKQRQIKRNLRILIRLQRKTRLLIQTNLQSPRTVRHRMLIRVIQRPGTVKRNED